MVSCEICKIFINTYFEENMRTTAFKTFEIIPFSLRSLTKTGENFIKCRYFSLYLHGCFHVFGILALDAIWKYIENVLKLTWQTSSFTTRRGNERLEGTIVNGGGLITTSLFQVNYLYYIKIRFLNYSSRKKYLPVAKLNYDIITLRHWNRYEWWRIYQLYTLKSR